VSAFRCASGFRCFMATRCSYITATRKGLTYVACCSYIMSTQRASPAPAATGGGALNTEQG
jgi:hypothetical protein